MIFIFTQKLCKNTKKSPYAQKESLIFGLSSHIYLDIISHNYFFCTFAHIIYYLFHDILPYDITGSPCGLQVKTTRYGIYIQHLTCEKQMWTDFTLKCMIVYITQ